jgi:hypothetical protein
MAMERNACSMRMAGEQGVALVLVLILMGVLSVLASSLIFVSQTETWASENYELMSEARYGAESGIHRAANYLVHTYVPPTAMTGFVISTSPVQYSGHSVRLRSSGTSNYPGSTVPAAFAAAAHGTLTGGHPVTYDATATLVSMRQVTVFGSVVPVTVQTWRIVGVGAIGGARPAQVSVEVTLERQVSPMFSYAVFATDNGCGALSWSGGGYTNSYDSTQVVGGVATFSASGGNVGTNGNLDQNGGPTIINGSLSTPRTGVGNCTTGTVTALTLSGSSPPTEGLIELPQPITYPTPDAPSPPPTGDFTVGNSSSVVKPPGSYGNITVKGTLHLTAGTYNINSLTMNANGVLVIDSGPVVLRVAGYSTAGNASSGQMATPFDLTGGSLVTMSNLDPAMFQITYAGSGTIKMAGGSQSAGLLYAPNATVQNNSANAEWYGALIARRATDAGHAVVHYDRHLKNDMMTVGPWMMSAFSWQRF